MRCVVFSICFFKFGVVLGGVRGEVKPWFYGPEGSSTRTLVGVQGLPVAGKTYF